MDITPLIPDGYTGPIKRLTCSTCKHIFYITQDDYHRHPEVRFCHECSLIVREELEKTQGASPLTPPTIREKPVVRPPASSLVAPPTQSIPLPQPRTIDREKMTVGQLFEEAKMLRKTWRYYEWKGRALLYLDRYEEALLSYEEALRLDISDADLYVGKAGVLTSLKRFDEALTVCEQAIQLAPAKSSVYKEKAGILTRQKRYEEALPAYQRVVQLEPNDAFAYEEVGDTLCKLERFADAIKAYNQALRLSPDFTRVYQSKAHALEKLGHYEQALAACNKALQLHPKNGDLLFSRAGVLKKLLRYEEANADYLSAQVSAQATKSDPWLAACCIIAKVDLKQVAEAKTRLQAAGKEISDEAIEAEIHLMYQEQKIASLKSSPLFQPICLVVRDMQEWSGAPKQLKELLSTRFPDDLKKLPRSPARLVEVLKEITPALQEEGIAIGLPPETTLVTLTSKST